MAPQFCVSFGPSVMSESQHMTRACETRVGSEYTRSPESTWEHSLI